jgi:hypothetical protein
VHAQVSPTNAKRAREQRFACVAGFRTKKARALWGDTRSRSAVIGKLNRTCRQIEGRWRRAIQTWKSEAFNSLLAFGTNKMHVIHTLQRIVPHLRRKVAARVPILPASWRDLG